MFVYDFRGMHIHLCLTFGLLALVPDIVQAADEKRFIYRDIPGGNKLSNIRWSRSVSGIAKLVIRFLINSAVEVPTKSQQYRTFIKHGSSSDAVTDFAKLQPTKFQNRMQYSIEGLVGNVEVKLRLKDHIHNRRPSIEIADPYGSARPVKIVYIKDP